MRGRGGRSGGQRGGWRAQCTQHQSAGSSGRSAGSASGDGCGCMCAAINGQFGSLGCVHGDGRGKWAAGCGRQTDRDRRRRLSQRFHGRVAEGSNARRKEQRHTTHRSQRHCSLHWPLTTIAIECTREKKKQRFLFANAANDCTITKTIIPALSYLTKSFFYRLCVIPSKTRRNCRHSRVTAGVASVSFLSHCSRHLRPLSSSASNRSVTAAALLLLPGCIALVAFA